MDTRFSVGRSLLRRGRATPFALFALIAAAVSAMDARAAENASATAASQNVRWGTLPNGFRYAIADTAGLPTDLPAGYVIIELRVDLDVAPPGNLIELPHLFEHILLESFRAPDGRRMTSQDLRSEWSLPNVTYVNGAPSSFTLKVPKERSVEAIAYLRSIAYGAQLDPDVVLSEKRIVNAETLWREDSPLRNVAINLAASPQMAALVETEKRISSIRDANIEVLRQFYTTHYHARAEALYVTGDIDSAAIEAQIRGRFADISSNHAPVSISYLPPDFSEGNIKYMRAVRGSVTTLHLGYTLDDPVLDDRAMAIQVILSLMLQDKLSARSRSFGVRAKGIETRMRKWEPLGRPRGIDVQFSARSGEFSNAVGEILAGVRATIDEDFESGFEKWKAQLSSRAKSNKRLCEDQSSIHNALIQAHLEKQFGRLACNDGGRQGLDLARITASTARRELQRILFSGNFGLSGLAPLGNQEVGLAAVRGAYAKMWKVSKKRGAAPRFAESPPHHYQAPHDRPVAIAGAGSRWFSPGFV